MLSISKTLAFPPTFAEEWRQAVDAWRGPPSAFRQLRELTKRMRETPDALEHARASAQPPPAPATTQTGAPGVHDWDTIERLDAAYTRTYFADHNRAPTWKERRNALERELGSATPHLKTLQKHLPKIALLKERNLRSI